MAAKRRRKNRRKIIRAERRSVEKTLMYVLAGAILLGLLYQSFVYASIYSIRLEYVSNVTLSKVSDFFFDYEVTRYPSSVEISRPAAGENVTLGFVADPWNLNFGIIPFNGSYAKRQVILANSGDRNGRIDLVVFGNITPLVSIPKNYFVLAGNGSATLDVYLNSSSFATGHYTGEIDVIVKKARNILGSLMV